jgi:opacity protein-like surface antigen
MKTIALCLLVSSAALAQAKPKTPEAAPAKPAPAPAPAAKKTEVAAPPKKETRRILLAPKFGLFEPTSKLSGALFLGAEFGYLTPALDNRLAVVLEVDWVRPRASGTISDPRLLSGGDYSLGNAEVGILLSAVYRLEDIVGGLTPYGGFGPGLYLHRTASNAFGSQYVETEGRVGFQLMAGADYTLGPGAIFAEFRYHFSRVDFISTGNANVGGFLALGLGYRLRL